MVRDFSQKTVQELYETIRVNVDEEEQWKVLYNTFTVVFMRIRYRLPVFYI